jgi:hypothetical protein
MGIPASSGTPWNLWRMTNTPKKLFQKTDYASIFDSSRLDAVATFCIAIAWNITYHKDIHMKMCI